ncbi:MAG TPA: hypothetical protein VLO11_07625 [Luteolibacter sp.]|nr:hypothetical protein [Luteolibacter sp.]
MEIATSHRDPAPPDVGPDDVWGDPACLTEEGPQTLALPAKRQRKRRTKPESVADKGALRIDSRHRPRKNAELQAGGLEVEEINGAILRLAPEMPAVERVPRQFTFQAREPGIGKKRRGGETGEWGRRPHRHSLIWVCGAGTAIVGVVVGAMVMLPRVNRANAVEFQHGATELVIERIEEDDGPRLMAAMMRRQDEALEIYDAFTRARSVEELLPLLRDPAAVEALLRASVLGTWAPPAESGHGWNVKEENGVIHGILDGIRADHSKFQAYFVDVDGALRIDWKATTAHGTAGFADLAEGRGDPAEIRGWLSPTDFYTLAFPENEYRAYRLLSSDETKALWVYAEVGGEAAQALEPSMRGGQILVGNKEQKKVTLRLAPAPDGSMPNQWRLVELLHKEWIAP